jgi:transcriptional regulator
MYTPPAYREDNLAFLQQLMREWSFATIVTKGENGLLATHLPFLIESGGAHGSGRLTSHIARNNPQWHDFAAGDEALMIFQGPHAFISVNWYDNHNTFPTWNYGSIHCYGKVGLIEDPEAIRGILKQTIATYDTPLGGEWKFEEMPANMTEPRLRAIIGLTIDITRIEGKLKYNQDKSDADRRGVIKALSTDTATQPTAQFMARLEDCYRAAKKP